MEKNPVQLIIYTKPAGCFQCSKTKDLFAAQGVPFLEVDITTNAAALEYVTAELGYTQAPVVLFAHGSTVTHWSGLDPSKIADAIALYSAENLQHL